MTMQEHPSEIELLELVEGDLDDAERGAIEAHLAGCVTCAAARAELEQSRGVLRSLPLLELPPKRRALIFDSLPRQDRDRSGWRSPKRLALVAVPVAAAVAAVVAISVSRGGGTTTASDEAARAAAPAAVAEAQTAGGATAAPPAATPPSRTTAPSFAAPAHTGATETAPAPSTETTFTAQSTKIRALGAATDVAVVLESAGVHVVEVRNESVIVTGDPAAVRQALDGRVTAQRQKSVEVIVRPAGS